MASQKNKPERGEIIHEWLDLFPIREHELKRGDTELAVIEVPHPENWFTRIFLPKPKHPAQIIRLDEFGSFVWELCDGNHTIRDIADRLVQKFGDSVKPVEERTVIFVQMMYKQEFVKMFGKNEDAPAENK